MNNKNKRVTIIIAVIAIILSVPLIAMQFTNEVDWDFRDFIIMGFLLSLTGFLCEMVFRRNENGTKRLIYIVLILLGLFLIWAELAVGIFGSPFAGS